MSLSQALNASTSGLRLAQAGLALISSNVANAETPGYVRKSLAQVTTIGGEVGAGVRVAAINRELDQYVLRQLRVEVAGGNYADLRARFYDRMQLLFGEPGADGTLETSLNVLTAALQTLATSPESYSARSGAVNAARVLAQQLNTTSAGIQGLRAEAEQGLANAAGLANEAMRQIANINQRLAASSTQDTAATLLMDQRDRYVDQLATLMDIRVVETDNNQLTVFTSSGTQLVGSQAAELRFDPQGTMTASTVWSADPAERSVGTITLVSASGDAVDLLANNSIRSGAIAAYVEMRDRVLVQAQAQLDAIAAAMSQALSDRTTAGVPVSSGAQAGFEVDVTGLLAGNTVRVTYTDVATSTQHTVTLMRVDDASVLPLGDDATADPNDRVVGINFSGGMASVTSQIAAALGADFTVSNPSGNVLRILDDGGVAVTMGALSSTKTTTTLTAGHVELPLFLDGGVPYAGAITAAGSQMTGLAARIAVNGALVSDPSRLVVYSSAPPTPAGDVTRADFLLTQLSQAALVFSPQSGIGNQASPFKTTLPGFLREVLGQQGQAAAAAANLKYGQDVVVNALQERFSDASGVNIDQEMAHLLQLQSAYAANARVLAAVKEMLDMLVRM
ncbi:MAG TPA: flagellar hook-associated protein FlgK [Xanthobacteraceae bacterium]|nr:flagellar hook-associated protein FlgK [Xanthobacteraceae bacterium]